MASSQSRRGITGQVTFLNEESEKSTNRRDGPSNRARGPFTVAHLVKVLFQQRLGDCPDRQRTIVHPHLQLFEISSIRHGGGPTATFFDRERLKVLVSELASRRQRNSRTRGAERRPSWRRGCPRRAVSSAEPPSTTTTPSTCVLRDPLDGALFGSTGVPRKSSSTGRSSRARP